ncbi:hypothetical protein Rhow_005819 [Rhodococcus wratislaviensis]|uniref:Uncharacterized protein n=1 Tax=Rhodococcus wratislaviensis TaxID=44752 RepID=A0A402BZP4_RHOWR|nr:hypothetical protein Rhow_005819 [Rhodococcus wratislaviensis]
MALPIIPAPTMPIVVPAGDPESSIMTAYSQWADGVGKALKIGVPVNGSTGMSFSGR